MPLKRYQLVFCLDCDPHPLKQAGSCVVPFRLAWLGDFKQSCDLCRKVLSVGRSPAWDTFLHDRLRVF